MYSDGKAWIAKSENNLYLLPKMANRHGLIAGATGTGKTITMKVMAESFSDMGVPVFFSDVKGDLTGTCTAGENNDNIKKRVDYFGLGDFKLQGYPTRFWDIFGEQGHPVRVTISGMGPVLLSKLLGLTDVQQGVLNIVFKVADDNGLLLLDLKDLRSMLNYVGENHEEFTTSYGNVSTASIGAIQRALLAFEQEGSADVFGEPQLDIRDWMRTDANGRGYINILESSKLINKPTVYATFLLWMMTELFEKLPEVGDLEKPRMVFFFDEAHLLFDDAPKALIQKIEQVVKLIRSKGVGIYFVTQSPADIPDEVLAQLSNKVQHALRAYTPAEQKAVRAAANSFRVNPGFKTEEALMNLGVGEAIVSFLDEKGIPGIAEIAKVLPPQSFMGAADGEKVKSIILSDEFELKYRETVDRESAYEVIERAKAQLAEQANEAAAPVSANQPVQEKKPSSAKKTKAASKTATSTAQKAATIAASTIVTALARNAINSATGGKKTSAQTIAKRAASNALSSAARSTTTSLIRGLFGNLK